MAICWAMAMHFGVPFLRDNVRDEVEAMLQRHSRLNLLNIGQLLSNLDLSVSLAEIPARQLDRIPTPAVLEHQGNVAVLEGVEPDGRLRLLEPELGLRVPLNDLLPADSDRLRCAARRPDSRTTVQLEPVRLTSATPQELIEVIATSAVVNVLAGDSTGDVGLINAQTGGDDSWWCDRLA